MSFITLALDKIAGRSPLNVRGDAAANDDEAMGASIAAVGMLQPIIVRDDGSGWEVLDGGRRLSGLRFLRDRGRIPADWEVPILVDGRSEAEAREASLAANVMRRPLHPVEEFEAFARLVHDGFTVDRIAADFNVTTRFVRQRLALDKLSPAVRDAWRAGRITADMAAAYTVAPDHAAQDALLADPQAAGRNATPFTIRHFLTREALKANSPEALYVGLDAYAAAGGAVDDNLFDDYSLCLDGGLLKRLARAKMTAEGEALMDRCGFGFIAFRDEATAPWNWTKLPTDVTQTDANRLAEIDAEEAAIVDKTGGLPEGDTAAAFRHERFEIELRAVTRGSRAATRATAGILLSLTNDGELKPDLGLVPPKADRSPRVPNPRVADLPREPEPPPPPRPDEDKKPGRALIESIDAARSAAFAALVAQRPELAIVIATAALSARSNRSPVRIEVLARSIDETSLAGGFAAACVHLLGAARSGQMALNSRFADAIAATLVVRPPKSFGSQMFAGVADPADTTALAEVITAFCGGDTYSEAMRDALDYEAYFKAATREAAISAVTEVDGDANHARTLRKVELVAFTAELAKHKGWLPRELRPPEALPVDHPHATPVLSLAEAMAEALEDDGGFDDEASEPVDTPDPDPEDEEAVPEVAVYAVSDFLTHECEQAPGAAVKASELYEAYKRRLGTRSPEVDKVQTFSTAVTAYGVAKKRRTDGVHFLDLRLATQTREAA